MNYLTSSSADLSVWVTRYRILLSHISATNPFYSRMDINSNKTASVLVIAVIRREAGVKKIPLPSKIQPFRGSTVTAVKGKWQSLLASGSAFYGHLTFHSKKCSVSCADCGGRWMRLSKQNKVMRGAPSTPQDGWVPCSYSASAHSSLPKEAAKSLATCLAHTHPCTSGAVIPANSSQV